MNEGIAVTAMPSEVDPGAQPAPLMVAIVLPGADPIEIEVSQKALDKVLFDTAYTNDVRETAITGLYAALMQMMMNLIDVEMSTEFDDVVDEATYDRQIGASEARVDLATRAVDRMEVTHLLALKSFFAKA